MKLKDIAVYRLEIMSSQEMIYMRRCGAYGPENYELMDRFRKALAEKNLLDDNSVILGIARDDMRVTPPEKCGYDVCLVGITDLSDEGICRGVTDEGRYLVLEIPHTKEAVGLAWQEGITFVIEKGYEPDFARLVIERYANKMICRGLCEIMFPVL